MGERERPRERGRRRNSPDAYHTRCRGRETLRALLAGGDPDDMGPHRERMLRSEPSRLVTLFAGHGVSAADEERVEV